MGSALCGIALGLAGAAHAAVATFDNPSLIDIDPVTSVATYVEAGAKFSGDAASFLTIDGVGTAGSGGLVGLMGMPFTLAAAGGGLFNLLGLDYGAVDLSTAPAGSTLGLRAVLADNSEVTRSLVLGNLPGTSFQSWNGLRQVTFAGQADFVLDNVNLAGVSAVPEPAPMAMMGAGLTLLLLATRRRAGQSGVPGAR